MTRPIYLMLQSCLVLMAVLLAPPGAQADQPAPAPAQSGELRRFEFTRIEMGVDFRIAVYACQSDLANNAVEAAFARIHTLNGIMSDYDGTSELRQLCDNAEPGRLVPVSVELFEVLKYGQRIAAESDGAFDVTVGPLTRLWRRSRRQKTLPPADELAEARAVVGWKLLTLEDGPQGRAALARKGMRIDLGGIAQGYAADEALRVLKAHGLNRALIDASGDVMAGDPPPGQAGWQIAVTSLKGDSTIASLCLANRAVSTSGDAFQFVEIDGQRYSHIVTSQTGLGLTRPISATIIARTGMEADSLATAVCVLGPERGLKLLSACEAGAGVLHPETGALVLEGRDDGTVQSHETELFTRLRGIVP